MYKNCLWNLKNVFKYSKNIDFWENYTFVARSYHHCVWKPLINNSIREYIQLNKFNLNLRQNYTYGVPAFIQGVDYIWLTADVRINDKLTVFYMYVLISAVAHWQWSSWCVFLCVTCFRCGVGLYLRELHL